MEIHLGLSNFAVILETLFEKKNVAFMVGLALGVMIPSFIKGYKLQKDLKEKLNALKKLENSDDRNH